MGKPTRKTSRMKPAIQVKIPATRVRASAGSTWVESSNSTAGPLVISAEQFEHQLRSREHKEGNTCRQGEK